jgi:hypothetical protein
MVLGQERRLERPLVALLLVVLAPLSGLTSCRSIPNPYGLKRGPYLQFVTPDTVWVIWDTREAEPSRVEYGPNEALDYIEEDSRPTVHHAVLLAGLSPYRVYRYRVGDTPVFSFRSGADQAQQRFRFVVVGDTQTYHDRHRAMIEEMLKVNPDWMIHLGDMTEHGESSGQWDDFFSIEAPLLATTPSIATIGNHQRDSMNYYDAYHLPGNEHWYSYTYGNARFVCLEGDGYPAGAPPYTDEELV